VAHPQNSPRGLFVKNSFAIPAGKGLQFDDYSASANLLTADANGLVLAGGVKVSNQKLLKANSTGLILPTASAKPSTDSDSKFVLVLDSTGRANIAVNTTGTTWKYMTVTSVITG
jgi:hypothetical protein